MSSRSSAAAISCLLLSLFQMLLPRPLFSAPDAWKQATVLLLQYHDVQHAMTVQFCAARTSNCMQIGVLHTQISHVADVCEMI
jgi:hypothetical protein